MKPDLSFNAIFILTSMPDHQKGTEAAEELCTLINRKSAAIGGGNFASIHHILNREGFDECMATILHDIRLGTKPVLHFDMHGVEGTGEVGLGLALKDGNHVLWAELENILREMNILTGNNLFVSMSTCYGGWLLEAVTLQKPCTFYGYIGPEKKMDIDDVNACFMEFWDAVFDYRNVIDAIKAMKLRLPQFAKDFAYINCEKYWKLIERMRTDPEFIQHELNRLTSLYKQRYPNMTVDQFQEFMREIMVTKVHPEQFEVYRKAFFHEEFDRSLYIKD